MMTTTLRQVLDAFERAEGSVTLGQMARQLNVAPGVLEGMIAYWVRKGKIRESASPTACQTCSRAKGCPFVLRLPRSYERATGDTPSIGIDPPCACGR